MGEDTNNDRSYGHLGDWGGRARVVREIGPLIRPRVLVLKRFTEICWFRGADCIDDLNVAVAGGVDHVGCHEAQPVLEAYLVGASSVSYSYVRSAC